MARQRTMSLFSSALLFLLASTVATTLASYEEHQVDVVVEGMVYCQSCHALGSWSLSEATPIPEAKVSVVCKDYKNRVNFYQVFTTDSNGYFYAQLKEFKMKHYYLDHPLHACKVHLVSSPNPHCNLVSNLNWGIDGAPFEYENKTLHGKNYEAVIYKTKPLAFRPNNCPVHY